MSYERLKENNDTATKLVLASQMYRLVDISVSVVLKIRKAMEKLKINFPGFCGSA